MTQPDVEPPQGGLPQFVTTLAPVEAQVGMHVIQALQHPDTVAVLTTVTAGVDGHQRILSVGVDAPLLEQVRALLGDTSETNANRVPCVGFHCYIDDGDVAKKQKTLEGPSHADDR